MSDERPSGRKKGWARRTSENIQEVSRNPRSLPTLIQRWLVRLWRSKGGGFYGFGYVVTFVVLEIRMLLADWQERGGIVDFVGQQLLEFVFRFFIETFIISLLAFLWPLLLVRSLGIWGVGLLVVGYFLFERLLKPRMTKMIRNDDSDTR